MKTIDSRLRYITTRCLRLLFSVLILIVTLLPFVICIFTAFKSTTEYTITSPIIPPRRWNNLSNFSVVWKDNNMGVAMRNSLFLTTCIVVITTMEATMLGFVLQRRLVRGSRIILLLYMAAALIPSIALQVGAYRIMGLLKLINSFSGYIIISSEVDIISITISMQQMSSIDRDIDSAARLDGCGLTRMFFRIHFPIMRPAVTTIAILKFIFVYNEYYNASIYLQDKSRYMTITTLLHSFLGPYGNKYNLICAGVIISIIPILLLFSVTQKNLYKFVFI